MPRCPVPIVVTSLAVAALSGLGNAACTSSIQPAGDAATPKGATALDVASRSQAQPGANVALAPDFELESLTGSSERLSLQRGQHVVLLDFWATYCEPCLRGMPHLNQLYRQYKDQGFVVWGISLDGPESVAQVRAEVSKLSVEFPVLLDQDSRVVALYNPKTSAPFSVLISRDGAILSQYDGYSAASGADLDAAVTRALAPTVASKAAH